MKKLLTLLKLVFTLSLVTGCAQEKAPKTSGLKDIEAIIKTKAGDIHVKLYASKTPVTVANFCNLSKRGFYVGSNFHRVVPGFVSQAGKHMSGAANPGFNIKNETYTENPEIKDLKHNKAGMLSMARLPRKHTNGSQWYITHEATPNLDGDYTVFGEVTKGLDIAKAMKKNTEITDIEIVGDTGELFKLYKDQIANWNKTLDSKFLNLRPIEGAKEENK